MLACEPRLVRLCAPPGYGKSSLARLFARRFDRRCICDCAGVRTATEFARRAMSALAGESPRGGGPVAVTRLRLHATQADEAAWSRALLEAWKSSQDRALFVLEHAEDVAAHDAALALLADLLAARPPARVVLVSTRTALPLRYSHYLSPHEILALSRDELRFNATEAAGIFEGVELPPGLLERVLSIADGWPIVLLLLALFAQYDSDIERLIGRLERAESKRLHEQLSSELLGAFTPEMMSSLLAIAAIPGASLDDIGAATGIRHATPIIDRLLRLPGFISSETGAYQVHPLLFDTLRAHYDAELSRYGLEAARQWESGADPLRAAELYAALGDEQSAAAALDRLPPTAFVQPSPRLIDAMVAIQTASLCAHPNLWIALLDIRRQSVDAAALYDEGTRLYESLDPDASPPLAHRMRVRLGVLAQELERLDEAQRYIELAGASAGFEETPEERRVVLMTSALIAAKRGRFSDADRFLDECDAVQGARHLRFDAERAIVELEKARFFGDWVGALKLSEDALSTAQRSGIPSRVIDAARSVVREAWYCNDEEHIASANQILEDCGGVPERSTAMARWQDALETPNLQRARELFDRAIEEIDESEGDLVRIVVRVSAALLLPAQPRRLLEARTLAERVESSPLAASLDLLIESPDAGDYGIFEYAARRVARSPLRARTGRLYLGIVRNHVRRGADAPHVSDRGLELLAALALLPAGSSKADLASAIWPELESEPALNALKMCVSRTRGQLTDKDAIVRTKSGYSLSDRVTVDIHDLEALLRRVRDGDLRSEAVRREVHEALRMLEARDRRRAADWAWFAPHESRLDELQREFTRLLGRAHAGSSAVVSAASSASYQRA